MIRRELAADGEKRTMIKTDCSTAAVYIFEPRHAMLWRIN